MKSLDKNYDVCTTGNPASRSFRKDMEYCDAQND